MFFLDHGRDQHGLDAFSKEKWRWHILSIPLKAGQGIGAETCRLDDVLPPDDFGSGSYTPFIVWYHTLYIVNGEPIIWKSQIQHLGNLITHDLSDLNDITYKKGVFISQVNRLKARFRFVLSGVTGHLLQTYSYSFYGRQTWDLYGKYVNQLNVECNKAVRWCKTHRQLLPLIVNGKSFKSQPCSRLHKYVNGFFYSENIYVSFIGKARVMGSLQRNWARLAVTHGLVPFNPPDEHMSAHVGMIKELLDMQDGINGCLHLSRTEIDDLIYHLCREW